MADIKITSATPNLYVPIIMHGREIPHVLQQGESVIVTDVVWAEQVIAQQLVRDGLATAATVV